MRKLKLQLQMTISGHMAGPNGEMDWLTFDWDEKLKDYVTSITEPVDCIVLGRKLAEGFIPHWAAVAADPQNPEYTAGKKFTDTPKVVFTNTLTEPGWPNTVLATGDLAEEIRQLKQQEGGDIMAYGGATFVSALLRHGLLDELHLLVNPAAISGGLTIFGALESTQPLVLLQSRAFDCGIVLLCYAPKRRLEAPQH